jgi:phosphoglycolate phosphatase
LDLSVRTLLFDLDGTLTDPRVGIVTCLRHALAALQAVSPTDRELERFIGPPLQETFRVLLRETPERADEAVRLYRERFADVGMYENEVYPGIPELLAALRDAGYSLRVATSKPGVYAERILTHFGLAPYFAGIHGSELSGARTNKAELLAHVLAVADIDPARARMIGDRSFDVLGARANGVRALGVLWGYGSRAELVAAGAEKVYESVALLGADLAGATLV